MRCTKCGTESTSSRKFCAACGNPLSRRCSRCGAENAPSSAFCEDCGTALGGRTAPAATSSPQPVSPAPGIRVTPEQADASAALEGERKTVTALFADIKGSTELEQDLDPEEARAIVDPALKVMIDAAHRYDGYVVQSTGDGIFAIFGAPIAHEDHPQRALYAALRMQEELKRYSEQVVADGGIPIEARVGVNTGEVVVRSLTTGQGQTEYTPIGHTTNLASRMQAVAPTGSIAVSEQTRRLVEGYFALKARGPTRVKGISEPVNVYEVTGLGPLRTRLQRSAGRGLTKFVGREREMEAMRNAAELARGGRGQIVAAMAEAGTGKSRLFFEFKAKNQSGWMVLEAFSVSHGKASAYLPVLDLLHTYFRIAGEDDQRVRREKVAGRLSILDPSLEDTRPYLFSLLGIVEGDDPMEQMDGQVKKRRTLEAIKRILLRESLNQPLMVIFEDLHWIDEETQGFLNLLAESIGTARVLMLVNYRPEYSHQWNSKTYYTQLRLDPLGKESAEEMLTAMVGESAEVWPLKRLIIEKTEGNPFFMEETVQVLFDEGALVRDGATHLTKPIGELKIPPTVQGILAARIDRLAPDRKELLQTLAVIGKEFALSLVCAVTGRTSDDLGRMLDELQLGEFIYEQPTVGDVEYTFKHALTQEVAYNSVLMQRRKVLHEIIGAALEILYASSIDDHLAELANHYGRSTNVDAAVQYLTSAGKQKMEEARQAEQKEADLRVEDEVTKLAAFRTAREKRLASAGGTDAALDSVDSIWRYPVKSMAGEEMQCAILTPRGVLGDRVYALIDKASNRVATVRTWAAALFNYRAQFVTEPELDMPVPDLLITTPGGLTLNTTDPDIHQRLSTAFGRNLTLMATAPAGLLMEVPAGTFPAGTLGEALKNVTDITIAGGAPPGAFFDYGAVHLIATSTLDHLQAIYPEGRFEVRRFRPNIMIRSHREPFIENSWVDRTLAIGDEVVLHITVPCPRCVNAMLPQADLPHDPGILRTIAQHNMRKVLDFGTLPCAGVYADVVIPGTIRRGDAVHFLD
jgi:class 3 adenylate cyclase/uncharacterized protein YcbX